MANRYSRYELKPYQSMYVDPGKVAVSTILKKRYDDNKLNYDMLNRTVGSMNVLEGDEQLKDNMINNINGQFEDISATGSFELAGNAVSKATTDFMTNDGLIAARKSYENYDLEKKTKAQLRAQGAQVLFDQEFVRDDQGNLVRDENGQPMMRDIASMHKSHYQDPETGEMVTSVYEPKFEQQLGYDEKMADLVANISTDPVFQEMGQLLKTGTHLGNKKVTRIVDGLMSTYLSTDEGIQQMRKLTQLDINPETGETYTAQEAQEKVKSQMMSIAAKQVGKGSYSYQKNPYWVQQQNPSLVATTSSNVMENNKLLTPASLFARDSEGNILDHEDDSVMDSVLVTGALFTGAAPFTGGLSILAAPFAMGTAAFVDWLVPGKTIFDEDGNYQFKDSTFQSAVNRCGGDPECMGQAAEDMQMRYDNLVQEVGGDVQMMSQAQLLAGRDEYIASLLMNNPEARQQFNSDKEFIQHITKEMENTQAQVSKVYQGDMEYIKDMNDPKSKHIYFTRGVHVRKEDGSFTNNLNDAVDRLADVHGVSEEAIFNAINNGNYNWSGTIQQGNRAGSNLITLNVTDGDDSKAIQVEVGNINEVQGLYKPAEELYEISTNGFQGQMEYLDYYDPVDQSQTIGQVEYKYDVLRNEKGEKIGPPGYYPVVTYIKKDSSGKIIEKYKPVQKPTLLQDFYDQAYQSAVQNNVSTMPTGI
ncbi:MAG: hypothetical protein CMI60_10920 [Parvibaculum sp.]|nr:hypothetical protein [Parvibaculum sp.]